MAVTTDYYEKPSKYGDKQFLWRFRQSEDGSWLYELYCGDEIVTYKSRQKAVADGWSAVSSTEARRRRLRAQKETA